MISSPQCGVYTEYTYRKSFELCANWEIIRVKHVKCQTGAHTCNGKHATKNYQDDPLI